MSNTIAQLIGEGISVDLARANGMNDEQLLAAISPWLDAQPADGLYAGTPVDRFNNWLQVTVLPQCRKLGENGQKAWDLICDPDSVINKDRVASILLIFSVMTGLQNLDASTLISIVVMAIRHKKRKQ